MPSIRIVKTNIRNHNISSLYNNFNIIIPKKIGKVNSEQFKEKIATISELAVGDACTGTNPRAIDPATMERLFTCIYYGTEVDF